MKLHYPTHKIKISQVFGRDCKNDPVYKDFYILFHYKHCGVDFSLPEGSRIQAAYPGIVVRREFHEGMGQVLGIRNGNIVILYAHLSKFLVKLGQKVRVGSLIALSGKTGNACPEPHLHFEIRDIIQPTLKDMVFDPPFGKEIKQWQEKFSYKVNNKNSIKTLNFFAMKYFGDEKYSKKILEENLNLNTDTDAIIKERVEIVIPNY